MSATVHPLRNSAGLNFELFDHGAPRRLLADGLLLNLFPGNSLEGGPANVWLRLRRPGGPWVSSPLLGPHSPLQRCAQTTSGCFTLEGHWQGCALRVQWRLAAEQACWFWHVEARNASIEGLEMSLVLAQDVGLASPQAATINEFYVSQYIDWQPLEHPHAGTLLAARQNQAQAGRYPWLLFGSLRRATAFATDALQFHGLAARADTAPPALAAGLPGERLQHEHAMALLEDAPIAMPVGASIRAGFFASFVADHPGASGASDLAQADAALGLAESTPVDSASAELLPRHGSSLFARAPMLAAQTLDVAVLDALFGPERRHAETRDGSLLSFFQGEARHIVLREKELLAARPHGHLLRAGAHLTPDERALSSTCWMGGVFHSMLTQGHVKFGRMLTTQRGYLGLFRSQGLRAFVRGPGQDWALLSLPSAFAIEPQSCRWIYEHDQGRIDIRASAGDAPQHMAWSLEVLDGPPLEVLLTFDTAIDDDDAGGGLALQAQREGPAWRLAAPQGSSLDRRLPGAALRIVPREIEAVIVQTGDDAMLYEDGRARGSALFCMRFAAGSRIEITLEGVSTASDLDAAPLTGALTLPTLSGANGQIEALASMLPWLAHNALVHYLSPRGLEQYSGGGWGVRDVCQGPLELLLAQGQTAPVRDLLVRVFSAQNSDGDWPQWFMFFARDAAIRASDSHGDVVFWPLLGLARYLVASGDAALLDTPLPYHDAPAEPLRAHVERAHRLIARRMIPGRALVAYGHGDWNDALQPADPALRESLCSAWTVTLHYQTVATLAEAFERLGQDGTALRAQAEAVRAAFQRELVRNDVVAGYAHFAPEAGPDAQPELWIHPAAPTGRLHYSLLPMMHAVLESMLTPAQANKQAELIDQHLRGPDGARLFEAPLPYHGGLMTRFQRAESSSFFGREIGIMYMHAHLRWAQMLAHLGRAEDFFDALSLSHPILLNERVPAATPRQANCYYSSSDAAYRDRYEAHAQYDRVAAGTVQLDGGWRVYSSGPGIMLALVTHHLLGLRLEADALVVDPVMPRRLAGLRARLKLADFELDIEFRPGSQGVGVTAIFDASGQPLSFKRRDHAYRSGAAEIARPGGGSRVQLVVETA